MWKSIQKNKRPGSVRQIAGMLLVLGLLVSGCKSSKQIGIVKQGASQSQQAFFSQMQEQAFQFETLATRIQIQLTLPDKEFSSKADLKMVKDSAFLLSIQPFLGIEVFRMEVSRDSIKVLDRLNKRYVAENYLLLKKEFPIEFNFYNLQALFTNQLFIPGKKALATNDYKHFQLKQEGATAEISIKDGMDLLYTFFADGERKLLKTDIQSSEDYRLTWDYSDFRLHEEQVFPMRMDAVLAEKTVPKGKMTLAYSRLQTDVPLILDFSIPANYKRMTSAQLFKSLSNKK